MRYVFVWILSTILVGGADAWFLSRVLGVDSRVIISQWVMIGALGAWCSYDLWRWQVHGRPMPAFPWRVLLPKAYRRSRDTL
jgi:hypothetical protein